MCTVDALRPSFDFLKISEIRLNPFSHKSNSLAARREVYKYIDNKRIGKTADRREAVLHYIKFIESCSTD